MWLWSNAFVSWRAGKHVADFTKMRNPMEDEGARLEKAHREAEAAFEIAQAELRAQIGVIQKSEYDRLSRVVR